MAVSGSDRDGPKWAEYVEVDGKMQPKPQNTNAGLTITEETLWKGVEKGFMKKEALKLTNLRAMRGSQFVMLKDCENIVAANVQRKSGKSTGDVQFIKQGKPAIVFNGIDEPEQIAQAARDANEKVLAMIRDAQQAHNRAGGKGKACQKCSRENPSTAKFCGKCGSQL